MVVIPLEALARGSAAGSGRAELRGPDDDGDGVNNCDDLPHFSQAGQTIGPDGCPVPVSIDLKGVNFDFDKAVLASDAISILSEAVQIFQRYPELRAEVAGHTDQCGSDAYNQKLSERRAKAVYDYLTTNGIDAARLTGPNGYGESRPLEDMGQAFPACKSEKNRRYRAQRPERGRHRYAGFPRLLLRSPATCRALSLWRAAFTGRS